MKSRVDFKKYLIDSLLIGNINFSDNLFFIMSKLSYKDLLPVIEVKRHYTPLFLKALHVVLLIAFEGNITGTFCKWSEFNRGRIVEVLVEEMSSGDTYLKNICDPLYRFLEGERYLPNNSRLNITREDVIKSAAKMLRDYVTNEIRRVDLAECFNVINRYYSWRKVKVYD